MKDFLFKFDKFDGVGNLKWVWLLGYCGRGGWVLHCVISTVSFICAMMFCVQ